MHPDAPELTPLGAVPSTHDGAVPMQLGEEAALLRREAEALLEAASQQQRVSAARARRFARAVIESTPAGRAALGVLDGGVLAGARLVVLAGEVASATHRAAGRKKNAGS